MTCNCTESKMCLACGPAKSAKHRPSDTGGELARDLTDIATGVMAEWNMLDSYDEEQTQRFCVSLEKSLRAALATPVAAIPAAGSSAWISVDDERKPEPRKPVLLFVRTLTRCENDDGKPFADEGEEVTMGEWRTCVQPLSDYFDCYASPMSDNDWVTHWMPVPAAPTATKDRA